MDKKSGFFVFTPLSGEKCIKIHKDICNYAHLKPDHPDREKSWHWFATYNEALEYAMRTGRNYQNGLDCLICHPS